MTTTVIKPYRLMLLGVAVSLTLPLFGCLKKSEVVTTFQAAPKVEPLRKDWITFDKNHDGVIDRTDWRRMKASEKKTYVRQSLEDVGENPDALVSKDKTREMLLLEGLESVYSK